MARPYVGVAPWIGVDLDGTLAKYPPDAGEEIGAPIPAMVARVVQFLLAGWKVKIFTARIAPPIPHTKMIEEVAEIAAWWENTLTNYLKDFSIIERDALTKLMVPLTVTATKDFGMIILYDDRVVQVEPNTGEILGQEPEEFLLRP